jgi:NO-binding membrane sensor protein with MHYT domain
MLRVLTCLGTEHDWRLVIVAGVLCFLASLTAMNLLGRARALAGGARMTWLAAAGTAAGCGIWATHFIAMLAYQPGISIGYDIALTALSLVAAIVVTGTGFGIAVYSRSPWGPPIGGGIVGGGIACMHYLGMWAVELPGRIIWAPDLVAVSIVAGMAFGVAALTVVVKRPDNRWVAVAALLLTLAIVSHHFIAMGAVEIAPDPGSIVAGLSPTSLALAIAATIAVLSMSVASAFADGRVGDNSLLLATALNNMTQGVVMFDAAQRLVICNDRYLEMYGLSREVVKPGCTLSDLIEHRIETKSLGLAPAKYVDELVSAMTQGQTINAIVETPSGRAV